MRLDWWFSGCVWWFRIISFFFFNNRATTEIYTLSLHDALPIYPSSGGRIRPCRGITFASGSARCLRQVHCRRVRCRRLARSEEHTSELQSQSNLVCRLLLEKKKP